MASKRLVDIVLNVQATTVSEFTKAVGEIAAPSLNFVFADILGNIGSVVSGRAPIRGGGHKGMVPVEGWTGTKDWEGWVPFEEMPSSLNPAKGFVVSANHP